MTTPEIPSAAARAKTIFDQHDIELTLGGEPTFVPLDPSGTEWTHAAVGPTKLDYAWKVAALMQKNRLPGAAVFYCPGKLYPGEVNPRWALRLVANRDGTPLFQLPTRTSKKPTPPSWKKFATELRRLLEVSPSWQEFSDPRHPGGDVLAIPLDHDGVAWQSGRWTLPKKLRLLLNTEGPAGLRLPLDTLPDDLPRRTLTLEHDKGRTALFFPPLQQEPFLALLGLVESAAQTVGLTHLELQGYLPPDDSGAWTLLGLTADPGVLEINLPACHSWEEYASWTQTLTTCCEQAGLRSWKEPALGHPEGTGGGNHLLWGGPDLDRNPFFARPAWLAAILRFWQHHPSLAYLFTGCYVGTSSQAPRPDESARDLHDLEMAYAFLESLPPGDHRSLIHETLRHIQIDITGNGHRSEICFDKFWDPTRPAGALGLIEFRAIESLPHAEWMSAVALLWTCLAAHLLNAQPGQALKLFGPRLHDEYFLPQRLWDDLSTVLALLRRDGFALEESTYRAIWEWRFPKLLAWSSGKAQLTIRKALESWPLLCETPLEGGATSRFVDTSMHRLEFQANEAFTRQYEIQVARRDLSLAKTSHDTFLAGLRFRRTNLYPALHPGIAVQLPLEVTIIERKAQRQVAAFAMKNNDHVFHKTALKKNTTPVGPPCRGDRKGSRTFDLRLD